MYILTKQSMMNPKKLVAKKGLIFWLFLLISFSTLNAQASEPAKKPEIQSTLESVTEEKTEPVLQEKIEPPAPVEIDIFQSAVIIKNESYRLWVNERPWMSSNAMDGFGTGFILSGNQILTNAHVVLDAKYITVKHFKDRKFYKANVKYIGYDCDLALLEVEDPAFANPGPSVPISQKKPIPGSEIMILGYPEGSQNLSVERGIITGTDKLRYAFSGADMRNVIRVQTGIRHGFSGGPAIEKNELTGLAFQISKSDPNTAFLIPSSVILHFLQDIKDGKYDGFPSSGFSYQQGTNKSLREFFKIPEGVSGILINSVFPESSFYGSLKKGDFVYKIDEKNISSTGVILENSAMTIEDILENRFIGDEVNVMFYREGKDYYIKSRLKKPEVMNLYRYDSDSFFLDSGLVFQPLSRTISKMNDPAAQYHYNYFITDKLYKFAERDVVLTHIFSDPENHTYERYKNKIVETINGYAPRDLAHMQGIWNKLKKETVVLKFRGEDLPLILDSAIREQINIRTRKRYSIENN